MNPTFDLPDDPRDVAGPRVPEPSHWETRRWPGIVLVAIIVLVLVCIWLIAHAVHSDKNIATRVGPEVTAYLRSIDAPEATWVAAYTTGHAGVVRIETTLTDTGEHRNAALALCELLTKHHFDGNPNFVVIASAGAQLAACG
jgi:hypothetical protein